MHFINEIKAGEQIREIYMVKDVKQAVTKNGKPYLNVTLQDKTGTINAKIWDPDSPGIEDFEALDYISVGAESQEYQGNMQLIIRQVKKAQEGDYVPSDYLPCSEYDIEQMYSELFRLIDSVKTDYMQQLLRSFFEDSDFKKKFCFSSAAKSVHHNFVGGLLEHTLSVTRVCNFFAKHYAFLDRDLLLTAAICHDIGKIKELSPYPANDYTDEGQLVGHIVIGAEMVRDHIKDIPGFPEMKARELIHCILAHHGELEFGSPKKPALCEAMALSFADNVDAKMETMRETIYSGTATSPTTWKGMNRFLGTNLRGTFQEE